MSAELDKAIEQLNGRFSEEELQELSYRIVDEVEPRPWGVWKVTTEGTDAGPINVDPANVRVEWTHMLGVHTVTVSVYNGQADGIPVVQIDGDTLVRVNMNDYPIWNADPDNHEHQKCRCVEQYEEKK